MDEERLRKFLPNQLKKRSMTERVIPKGYSLKKMLNQLVESQGEFSALMPWEKSCYRDYELGEIQDIILESYKEEWPCIIRTHLLSKEPKELGGNAAAIFLIAYVAETHGTGRNVFSKVIKEMGITSKEKTVRSLWRIGKSDGQYLGVINADGSVRDGNFLKQWTKK
jgi:hypothetical protein